MQFRPRSVVRVPALLFTLTLLAAAAEAQTAGSVTHGYATLTSTTGRFANGTVTMDGRLLTPAGRQTVLGDFPAALAVSPDNRIAVVANSGQGEGQTGQGNQSLQVVDPATGRVLQTLTDHVKGQDSFYNGGVAFSRDGRHVYVTGGGNDSVYDYAVRGNRLRLAHRWLTVRDGSLPNPPQAADVKGYSRGVAVTPDGRTLVVTNEQGGTVVGIDTRTGSISWTTPVGGASLAAGSYPGAVAISPDGGTAYVALQGANAVLALQTATGGALGTVAVGDHPVAIALTPDGSQAYVADANDDSLAVLSLGPAMSLVTELSTHLMPGEVNGSSPSSVAVDVHRGAVYVTNAGDNTLAVFHARSQHGHLDAATLHPAGQVPLGMYPTAVGVTRNGTVLAASAKGYGGVPVTNRNEYDGNDMSGLLSRFPAPTGAALARDTARARYDQTFDYRLAEAARPAGSPIPTWADAGHSPIKHVVLVVRENRTFDQEFGDLPALGRHDVNVDPSFVEFGLRDRHGRTVTPNAHAIAAQFSVSDNFYSDGEASIQGHHWTTEGSSTLYDEESWLHYYSNRNHPYDPVAPVAYPRCGSLFQQVAAAGMGLRDFGELEAMATGATPTLQPAPGSACSVPGGAYDGVTVANSSPTYPDNLTLTSVPDTTRLSDFEKEYAPLVAANRVPAFTYLIMGNDHTDGTTPGSPTPQALVATNDEAVGGLVDYLSHTPQWSSTAVFIEEDDSQDGLDHVDGHRNILLVASPWAAPGAIGHFHSSQASVTAMVERILGLAPISSYAQYAPIPYDMFTSRPHLRPYVGRTPTYPLTAKNGAAPAGTPAAVPVDVSQVDLAGPVLEAQLWQATNPGQPLPAMLVAEIANRGGITAPALAAWAAGRSCGCSLLLPGYQFAAGYGDG